MSNQIENVMLLIKEEMRVNHLKHNHRKMKNGKRIKDMKRLGLWEGK